MAECNYQERIYLTNLFCLFCFSVQRLAEYFASDVLADAVKYAKYNLYLSVA